MQFNFHFVRDLPVRPSHRCLWAEETNRLARLSSDQRAADRQRLAEAEARLTDQLSDLRHRVADVERATELADITEPQPNHHN